MKSIIRLITHPYAWELHLARHDEAIVTGQPMTERPYWYENTETGQLYHDIMGCVGWPSEINNEGNYLPGYIAIVGIVRPNKDMEHYNPLDANFQLLAEAESNDVPTLLSECLRLREKYGFGLNEVLKVWWGDPDRFLTTLALRNERLIKSGGDNAAILVSPPNDFYMPKMFDNYVRSIKSCLVPGNVRFYFGTCEIIKNRLREFKRDDPAVMAVGGMVHSLLTNCTWMDQVQETVFNVEREYA